MGTKEHGALLKDLGKFKMGKACIYVNKLSDIHIDALKKLMGATIEYLRKSTTKRGRILFSYFPQFQILPGNTKYSQELRP